MGNSTNFMLVTWSARWEFCCDIICIHLKTCLTLETRVDLAILSSFCPWTTKICDSHLYAHVLYAPISVLTFVRIIILPLVAPLAFPASTLNHSMKMSSGGEDQLINISSTCQFSMNWLLITWYQLTVHNIHKFETVSTAKDSQAIFKALISQYIPIYANRTFSSF